MVFLKSFFWGISKRIPFSDFSPRTKEINLNAGGEKIEESDRRRKTNLQRLLWAVYLPKAAPETNLICRTGDL